MTNVKVQSSNETLSPKTLRIFDIKPFVINLKFGFWHLTFVVSWRSMPWAMHQ
jgi:hypothetical protein